MTGGESMKRIYHAPDIEIIKLHAENAITLSFNFDMGGIED